MQLDEVVGKVVLSHMNSRDYGMVQPRLTPQKVKECLRQLWDNPGKQLAVTEFAKALDGESWCTDKADHCLTFARKLLKTEHLSKVRHRCLLQLTKL